MNAVEIKGYMGTNLADSFFFPVGTKSPSIFRNLFKPTRVTEIAVESEERATFLSTRYKRELEEMLMKHLRGRQRVR